MDTSVDPATLTMMMGKFDQALESLSTISNNVSRILDFLLKLPDNQISTQLSTATEGTSQDNSTQNTTQNTTQQLCESIKELINETCQPKIDKEATKIKTSLINIWDKNLSNRRNQFWLQIRNENTAKVYEEWRDKTPIILPQKLQMYPINGEPEDQTSRRERQVLDNFRTERDLLSLRAESNRESYIRIDEEMLALISEKASGRTKEKLLEMWRNDTKQQETISIRRWDNNNKVWLKKNTQVNSQQSTRIRTHLYDKTLEILQVMSQRGDRTGLQRAITEDGMVTQDNTGALMHNNNRTLTQYNKILDSSVGIKTEMSLEQIRMLHT